LLVVYRKRVVQVFGDANRAVALILHDLNA
jgi:hypothetical protein